MKTLIELFDERPLENVLAVDMFRPERVAYICPAGLPLGRLRTVLERYFAHRGLHPELILRSVSLYSTGEIRGALAELLGRWPDAVLDITGGTDAALFAAGQLSAGSPLPVFTYSRRKNRFFLLQGEGYPDELPCTVEYRVEDCIRMAGGEMRPGRVDQRVLAGYLDDYEPFFQIYLRHRRQWNRIVNYIQRLSRQPRELPPSLYAEGAYEVKGERGSRIAAPEDCLRELEAMGFLRELRMEREKGVSFRFRDLQVRSWLRDVGSVLELYVYRACLETGLFQDVRCSAVVDWEGDGRRDAVTNELDVLASRGVTPLFISCKTCDARTEALNELAILRDRFGGEIARSAIVTAERGGGPLRRRAAELGISVIDLEDLAAGRLEQRLEEVMRRRR